MMMMMMTVGYKHTCGGGGLGSDEACRGHGGVDGGIIPVRGGLYAVIQPGYEIGAAGIDVGVNLLE